MPEVKHTDSPFPFILQYQPSLKISLLVYIGVTIVSPVPLGLCDP